MEPTRLFPLTCIAIGVCVVGCGNAPPSAPPVPAAPTGSGGVGAETGAGGAAPGGGGTVTGIGGATLGTGGDAPAAGGSQPMVQPDPMLPFAGYDPTVQFSWTETLESSGTCKAGTYEGTFDGIYSPGIAVFPAPIPVLGNIVLTLEESTDGEFFNVADGKVIGLALAAFPFEADISGTLNCTTGQLEDGFLDNGIYFVGPLSANFSGPITADYDKLSQSFTNATWDVGEPAWAQPKPLYGGFGTWQATWTGP